MILRLSRVFQVLLPAIVFMMISCGKDDGDDTPKTKTELISSGIWRFSDAVSGSTNISGQLQACQKDNLLSFAVNGAGTTDEGVTKCNGGDPQSSLFVWSFQDNESKLYVSATFFTGGTTNFSIVELTEAKLSISQIITLNGVPQNATFHFIH